MSDKTSVVSQLFEEQLLASDQRVLDVDNHADVSVLHVGLIIPIVRRVLAADRSGNAVDHPTQWLIVGMIT